MIIAVDAAARDTTEAEHVLHELLAPVHAPVVACTHLVSGDGPPHYAVSVTGTAVGLEQHVRAWAAGRGAGVAITRAGASSPDLAGPSTLVRGAYVAAVEAALGSAGRLVRWPGHEHAYGVLTAADLRARCGIDQIEALGGLPVEDDSRIDTLGFLRPIRRVTGTVLQVQPAAGGLLIPFELEHQQKCCADH
ncbi:hypothetical protein Kfla_6937 [Kribbella flavida DSM 17836]|uniref:Uncharacterized protein n=1 Tax=Kribbella flavida (strain DSM 17836 / JCM 10339 / NBRC 14399) TaxID=479435 RepID=D2Q3Q4_KRIFD|nr:hypothetical protein [Kribbella flavida]ADB35926.1 hypothetical protein Kfla_6937 [Kribbella flavida DSM 17836]